MWLASVLTKLIHRLLCLILVRDSLNLLIPLIGSVKNLQARFFDCLVILFERFLILIIE